MDYYKICDRCQAKFKSKSTFYHHRKTCAVIIPNETVYKECDKCKKEFRSRWTFYAHRKLCKMETTSKENLKSAYKTCDGCDREFGSKSTYYYHMKTCRSETSKGKQKSKYKICDRCEEEIPSKFKYYEHRKICALISKTKQCPNCMRKFRFERIFHAHRKLCKRDMSKSNPKSMYKTCDVCLIKFGTKSTFYYHKKTCRKETSNYKICDQCKQTFTTKSKYYKHRKTCEGNIPRNALCMEENCNFVSRSVKDLISHLKEVHSIESEIETKTFQDYAEFENWKEEFEKSTMSAFTCISSSSSSAGKVKYYRCTRSGSYKSRNTGKRAVKKQGLQKIGHVCTASFKVHIDAKSSSVTVTVCPLHYGHENTLDHTRISKSDRLLIANQLSMGVDHDQILQNMFKMSPRTLQRQHLATKQDLRNISRAFGIGKMEKHSEDYTDVENGSIFRNKKKQGEMRKEDFVEAMNSGNVIFHDLASGETHDLVTLKSTLISKAMALCDTIKLCDDKDLLLTASSLINSTASVVKTPKRKERKYAVKRNAPSDKTKVKFSKQFKEETVALIKEELVDNTDREQSHPSQVQTNSPNIIYLKVPQ